MDSEQLSEIPDCKACQWWYDTKGECIRPDAIKCPEGVVKPPQQVTDNEYDITQGERHEVIYQ